MRTLLVLAAAAALACAQPAAHIREAVFAGVNVGTPTYPWVAYLHSVSSGVWSYSELDATRLAVKPFRLETNTRTGFCLYLRSISIIDLYGCGDGGVANTSTNLGGSFSGNGFAIHAFPSGLVIGVGGGIEKATIVPGNVTMVRITIGWGHS